MPVALLSAVAALAGSLIYGASDFFGGMAAKRMSAVKVTVLNSIAGLVLLLLGSLVVPAHWSVGSLVTGVLCGLAGAAALGLLYACLALGPMSILAPIMALVSAVVPITVGFARGERLSLLGYLGIAVGILAVLLICFVPGERVVRPTVRGVLMATGAGVAVGAYLVFIDLSPADSGPAPLIVCFVVTGGVMALVMLGQRMFAGRVSPAAASMAPASTVAASPAAPSAPATSAASAVPDAGRGILFAVLCGITDAAAAVLFLIALRLGQLSVVSVLGALSPAGTIILAAVVLRERIAVVQWVGLGVALVAAALLSLA